MMQRRERSCWVRSSSGAFRGKEGGVFAHRSISSFTPGAPLGEMSSSDAAPAPQRQPGADELSAAPPGPELPPAAHPAKPAPTVNQHNFFRPHLFPRSSSRLDLHWHQHQARLRSDINKTNTPS